jgi:uncharacterized protein (TIGR02452 family)
MSLSGIAKENLDLYARGFYVAPSGTTVDIRATLQQAIHGTVLYRPQELAALLAQRTPVSGEPPQIVLTAEATGAALHRLVAVEGRSHVVALNFASARNPGGGFLGGAKAQEEDICRCTALYPCLITQQEYYAANREHRSALYTDYMIYSPEVPFIRDEGRTLLGKPFTASFITAPAPNAGAIANNHPEEEVQIVPTFARRAWYVLTIAAQQRQRTVVLGAWGCGAFHNDPWIIAPLLRDAVADSRFAGAFDQVVMAVYDRSKPQDVWNAFAATFGGDAIHDNV